MKEDSEGEEEEEVEDGAGVEFGHAQVLADL
jgi:hypothetical protein